MAEARYRRFVRYGIGVKSIWNSVRVQTKDTFYFRQQNLKGKRQNAKKIDLTPIS
jgi:hypothetical protein